MEKPPPLFLAALKQELTEDPTKRGYGGKSLEEQAALLNASYTVPGAVITVDVPIGSIEGYLRSRLLMGGIRRFINAPPPDAPPKLADGLSELMGLLSSSHVVNITMTDPLIHATVEGILSGAVMVGLLSGEQKADLMAMSVSAAPATEFHPRIMDIAIGIEGAPNAVTPEDIKEAA